MSELSYSIGERSVRSSGQVVRTYHREPRPGAGIRIRVCPPHEYRGETCWRCGRNIFEDMTNQEIANYNKNFGPWGA